MISRPPQPSLENICSTLFFPVSKGIESHFWDLRSPIVHEDRCIGKVFRQGLEKRRTFDLYFPCCYLTVFCHVPRRVLLSIIIAHGPGNNRKACLKEDTVWDV
jgi:hypothetical protein